jgi:hypothetical protein
VIKVRDVRSTPVTFREQKRAFFVRQWNAGTSI